MNCWHSWCSSNNLRPRPHDTQVQFDQIRRFLKVLDNKFYDKSSPKNWQLFGLLWKTLLLYQKLLWLVLAYLGKNWATLYSNIWSHCMQQRNRKTCERKYFLKFWANHGLFLLFFNYCYFTNECQTKVSIKIWKIAWIVGSGFKHWTAGWKSQTKSQWLMW